MQSADVQVTTSKSGEWLPVHERDNNTIINPTQPSSPLCYNLLTETAIIKVPRRAPTNPNIGSPEADAGRSPSALS